MMDVVPRAAAIGMDPAAAIDLFAEINNLPRTVVRKFQKAIAAAKGPPPEVVDSPEEELSPEGEMVEAGGNGAGIVPALTP
jgi:hypothetical protein